MLISWTNCRRYSGATYILMHFVTSLVFRRLTPRSSTLLVSISQCCSIIFFQLNISCRRWPCQFVSTVEKLLTFPTIAFIRTNIDERANGIAMMISQTAWGYFASESYKQSSLLPNIGAVKIWICCGGLLNIFIMGVRSILSALNALLYVHLVAAGNSVTSSPSYPSPSGYSTQVYNVSAATTILTYNYTNEELAMLWNQIGQIAIGPIKTTVSPTPEPLAYPRPGSFHPQVKFRHPCTPQD
jgi:hypothetical protein